MDKPTVGFGQWYAEVGIHSVYDDAFDLDDRHFIEREIKERPLDFNLHLAVYILKCEQIPSELLAPLRQWVRDHKTLVVNRHSIMIVRNKEDKDED